MIAQKEDCMLISFAAVGGAGTTMGDSTEAEEYYRKAAATVWRIGGAPASNVFATSI